MLYYESILELVEFAKNKSKLISDIIIEDHAKQMEKSVEEVFSEMDKNLIIMEESVQNSLKQNVKYASGRIGGDAYRLKTAFENGKTLGGSFLNSVLVKSLAVAESNASMGRIVAAPTAGSCGIIPAVILTIMEYDDIPREKVIKSLFTAAGIGMVIANRASVSGAEAGCQAECGSASAMAAAAAVELLDGTQDMVANACAIALKNILGLVCDPVNGLVEVPCIKRNAAGASNSITAAEMALAGIESAIPVDEVIDTMKSIGDLMPSCLKETGKGGLAKTKTAGILYKHLNIKY